MTKFLISILLVSSLASCSSLGKAAVGAILDSGPSVNANAQLGKENRQTLTFGTLEEVRGDRKTVEAQQVGSVSVTNTDNGLVILLVVIGLLGWILPSPGEMGRIIRSWFRRKDA